MASPSGSGGSAGTSGSFSVAEFSAAVVEGAASSPLEAAGLEGPPEFPQLLLFCQLQVEIKTIFYNGT